jgi:hypothetical protein
MNIDDFLNLDEDVRETLIEAHRLRNYIISSRDAIKAERAKLDTREFNLQMQCNHPMATSRYVAHENEFGNLTGGGTRNHYCPDCGSRWETNE